MAIAFAREGARLRVVARTEAEIAETAALCRSEGVDAEPLVCDVADWRQIDAAVGHILSDVGRIDVVVHAAGVYGPIGPSTEVDPDAWTEAIRVNLCGTFNVCRAVLPSMTARRAGKVILLAGGGATAPLPFFSAYAASKAGTVRLAETLAEEVKDAGVQVNAIAPGLVDTRLQDDVLEAGKKAGPLLEKIRKARDTGEGAVPPELAAELAVFLASDASGSLTGKLIAAPYDPWRQWHDRGDELNQTEMFTIRRLDPHTLAGIRDLA